MTKLKYYQREQIVKWFSPSPGYVLDFSNKTFSEFFEDHFEINIYADAFSERGTSKLNRLLSFIDLSPPHVVIELLKLLWRRLNSERDETLESLERRLNSDDWSVTPDYVSTMQDLAAEEEMPFNKLIAELAHLPSHTVAPNLQKLSAEWTLDTVEREFSRAFENVERDPEAAITAACSMLESLFKSILVARSIPMPKSMNIQDLYKEVREPLGLSPSKELPATEVEADVRTILAALGNTVQGIGALRTHAGSAHGREKGFRRVDPRIARLAVSSATNIALFIIETWEKHFPDDRLGSVNVNQEA